MRSALSRPLHLSPLPALRSCTQFPSLPGLPLSRQRRCQSQSQSQSQTHRLLSPRAKFPAPRSRASPRLSSTAPAPLHIASPSRVFGALPRPHDRRRIHSGVDFFTLSAVLIIVCVGYGLQSTWSHQEAPREQEPLLTDACTPEEMAAQALPGRPGNLTAEQEDKLRQLWSKVLHICGTGDADSNPGANGIGHGSANGTAQAEPEHGLKKRMTFWSKKSSSKSDDQAPADGAASLDEKYGQTQEYFDAIATLKPEELRKTIWNMIKFDDPDAVMLRFLRARKWDVDRALVMLVSTMRWRISDMRVDEDVMVNGEEYAAAEAQKDPKGFMHDYMENFRQGKTYLHGVDKGGHPLAITRVRLHKPGELDPTAIERYTIFILEQGRMTVRPPIDTATLIFDLTGFSLANMDYAPLKFVIKALEANYPECLESILVHKAPWVFQGIWKVIKGWLDPVVASKIHFTNSVKDLEAFIDIKHIPKELEGQEDWEYKYIEPVPGENDVMKDTATRDALLAKHDGIVREYEGLTRKWIAACREGKAADEVKAVRDERAAVMQSLKTSYWEHDPYTRARSILDREGVIQAGGKVDYYPTKAAAAAPAPAAASTAANTADDDVD